MKETIKRNTAVLTLLVLTVLILASIIYLCKTEQPLQNKVEQKIFLPKASMSSLKDNSKELTLEHISLLLDQVNRFNVKIYLQANSVQNLDKGIYSYNNQSLTKVSNKLSNKLSAPLSLFITSNQELKDINKDSVKETLITAGKVEQTISMQAANLNLSIQAITRFNEKDILKLNIKEFPLLIIDIAKPS